MNLYKNILILPGASKILGKPCSSSPINFYVSIFRHRIVNSIWRNSKKLRWLLRINIQYRSFLLEKLKIFSFIGDNVGKWARSTRERGMRKFRRYRVSSPFSLNWKVSTMMYRDISLAMTSRGLSRVNDRGNKWDVGKIRPYLSSSHLSTALINKVTLNAIYDFTYRIAFAYEGLECIKGSTLLSPALSSPRT